MQWKGRVLYADRRRYVFKQKIRNAGKTSAYTVAVFKREMLFIEKSSEMIRYSTGKICTSGFLKSGVVYGESKKRTVKYITHPYSIVKSIDVGTDCFYICATDKNHFCIIKEKEDKCILEIYADAPPQSKRILQLRVPQETLYVVLRHRRLAVATADDITMYLLRKDNLTGALHVKKKKSCMLNVPIESLHAVDIGRVHLILVNRNYLVDGDGIILQLNQMSTEEKLMQIKHSSLTQIEMLSHGYKLTNIHRFFQYDTKGQEAFAKSLPWQARMRVHRQKNICPEIPLDYLFQQVISNLSSDKLLTTAMYVERYIHIVRFSSMLESPLFFELYKHLIQFSESYAQLMLLLAPEKYLVLEPDIFMYNLVPYNNIYAKHSKNIGYAFVHADIGGEEKIGQLFIDRQIAHTLEDPEYIRRVPPHMQSTNAIAECKEMLSGYRVGDFPFDEYDTENKRKKAFIFSIISSVGRGVFLLNRNQYINIFQIPIMKVFLKKNNSMITISSLNEYDKIWPSFHFAVSTVLSVPNSPFISTKHIEVFTMKEIMSLAGSIFGMGLKYAQQNKKLTTKERASLVKMLLLSLSRSNNRILIGAAILGDAFIMKGLGDKKLTDIIQYNLKMPKISSAMLMWNVFGLGILFMGQNDLFAKNLLLEYMERKGVISCAGENDSMRTLYYDKYHRIAAAFSFAYICIGHSSLPYIRMPDRTCEIIVNGLMHMNTKTESIIALLNENGPKATPVNRFYSSLMQILVEHDFDSSTNCSLSADFTQWQLICTRGSISIEDAYAAAGAIFAYGILHIPKNNRPCEAFVEGMKNVLYMLERKPELPSIILDYSLLAACLALNSTGDLCILAICRRLLSSLQSISHLKTIVEYSSFAGEYREQYGMHYGRIQHIKMCVSLLAPACGWMCVSTNPQAIAFLITSFYVEYPILPEDQDAFQVIRHFYTLSLVPKTLEEEEGKSGIALVNALKSKLAKTPKREIKVAIDIITTYFENNESYVFPPNLLEETVEEIYSLYLENTGK